ncbi:hypothetical protein PC119_g18178 [Phytophthora cactorum]|nr:hypothetical protein PC112_g17455 [Phytophthora cactorum]KAG2809253.1 hypothetical protein PC111_g16131 [Phytophthora cactorum]KAG2886920.1 hypothetical protein PC114_g19029 [Phytophthora cactorum]KAG2900913.1 hypothetical protein PC117_g21852 [Phytophthora cactorum]KAG2994889.1 hypothetical protein PC119_g18178 [Phytophthora cactorum]
MIILALFWHGSSATLTLHCVMTEPVTGDESAATTWEVEQRKSQLESVKEDEPQDEGEAPSVTVSKPMDKLKAFALQLMEEFFTQHKLEDTLAALQAELQRKRFPRPDDQLWFEMHNSCRVALTRGSSSCSSTLEKLLAFCVSPTAARAAGSLALDVKAPPVTLCLASPQPNSISKLKQTSFSLKQAYSQMLSPVIRPSQRHKHGAPLTPAAGAGRPKTNASVSATKGELSISASFSELEMDNVLQPNDSRPSSLGPVETKQQSSSIKKHKPKKKRSYGSDSNNKAISQPHPHPSRTESSMVMAFDEQIKRDLSSGRILARELRNLRTEQAKFDSLRRGTASLEAALARHDPYAKELVRERYGFIHRVECALCTYPFLPVNLPHRVSFKCIMDLHELWGYQPPQREIAARYRPPFCYDAVSVCRMCGPILFEHTTATPDAYSDQTMARASSLSALKTRPVADNAERRTFCFDPYALPPLFGDDVIEDGDSYAGEEVTNEILRGNGAGAAQESPAKAIVYSQQQTDTAAFMSSKEWEVINPLRSNIRQVMENTVKSP